MLRLFVPSAHVRAGRVRIAGRELGHLRVLRLEVGTRFCVFDETGREHEVVLARLDRRAAEASIAATRTPARESPLALVLAPALLKGSKMDLVVEKATELGVTRLAPVVTRHTIGTRAPIERWQRIALAAAKQSGRTVVPTVDPPRPFAELIEAPWPGLRLLAWEGERTAGLDALPPAAQAVIAVVGPEGGFADAEVAQARAHGFVTVRLSPRVLRAETAALVAAALCQHRWGDG
jgi:16S rRNA (uracil1498-N3)-methyltransferase